MSGLLSVVVPVYNGKKYIGDTIRMILNSEYKELEIIIVNDGSTDDSVEIIEKIRNEDKRVHLYNKENGGIVSSRNYGVEHSNGKYICFVDQDDLVKPSMYSKLIEKMEKDNSEMAMCSSGRKIKENESIFDCQKDAFYEDKEIREELLYPVLFNGFEVPIKSSSDNHYPHIWTCIFRMDFWKRNGLKFRAYINFEDDLLVKVEALAKASRVSTISDIGYLWRVNLKSETYAHRFVEDIGKKQDMEYQDMLESCKAFSPDIEFLKLFKQVKFCKQYLDAIHNLTSPNIKKDKKFIKEYYEKNIFNREFSVSIEGQKFLKSGRIKPKIILPLLAKRKTKISYYVEILLDKILIISLHSQLLTRLERRLKVVKHK